MNRVIRIIAMLAAMAACGCRENIRGISRDSVIVAFGDSLTSGEGADARGSYPAVLSRLLKCKVINSGISGERSGEGLLRLPSVLSAHKPDLVIICHGGNDMLAKMKSDDIAANIDAMVKAAQKAGSDVILVAVPKPGLLLSAAGFYKKVARNNRVACENKVIQEVLSRPFLKSDYIHPNAAGYQKIAEALAALIEQLSIR